MSVSSKTRKQKHATPSPNKTDSKKQVKRSKTHNVSRVLEDYRIACLSRRVSVIGRREVLNGRAKFGAFSAGKELPQIAAARAFELGDWRSGYYRNHTFTFA